VCVFKYQKALSASLCCTVIVSVNDLCVKLELYFMYAAMIGVKCQSAGWTDKLDNSFGACVSECIELAEGLSYLSRIQMLEKCVEGMCEDSQKPALFLEIATVLSSAGISALTTKDFMTALRALHDCYRPVQEIRRLTCETGDIYNEACVIEKDVAYHMATASALQAVRAGTLCSN